MVISLIKFLMQLYAPLVCESVKVELAKQNTSKCSMHRKLPVKLKLISQ